MRFLLDTNILSTLIRDPQGIATQRIAAVGDDVVCTSIIVAAELRFGAAKRRSDRLTTQVEAVLASLEIIPFEAPADQIYGTIRADLEGIGQPIGGNDLLIAAQAIALGHTVVTDNVREFSRVRGLRVENWLREQ